jgi:hypothetical protein
LPAVFSAKITSGSFDPAEIVCRSVMVTSATTERQPGGAKRTSGPLVCSGAPLARGHVRRCAMKSAWHISRALQRHV